MELETATFVIDVDEDVVDVESLGTVVESWNGGRYRIGEITQTRDVAG